MIRGIIRDAQQGIISADFSIQLPEEVLEKILLRIPFPYFHKVRVLSRCWYFKFPFASQCVRPVYSLFTEEVYAASSRWPTFCPAFVDAGVGEKDNSLPLHLGASKTVALVGFDRASESWHRFTHHPSIPLPPPDHIVLTGNLALGGCLIAVAYESDEKIKIMVANWLTGNWRLLDPPLDLSEEVELHVIPVGRGNYKLLSYDVDIVGEHLQPCIVTQLYDSCSRTWSHTNLTVGFFGLSSHSVYLDENLYCVWPNENEFMGILYEVRVMKYNLKDGTLTEIIQVLDHEKEEFFKSGVFLCGAKILVVTLFETDEDMESVTTEFTLDMEETLHGRARVFELQPGETKLTEVSRSPDESRHMLQGVDTKLVAGGDRIYFIDPDKISSYNAIDRSWKLHPALPGSPISAHRKGRNYSWFNPGQNPLALA